MSTPNKTMRVLAATAAAVFLLFTLCGSLNLRAGAQNTQSPSVLRQMPAPRATPTPPTSSGAQTTVTAAPQDDDDEVVRVSTNLTNILFTAVDKDQRFITNLRREDVRILEDNAPQNVSTFQRETDLPLSLAILVDISKSQEGTLPEEKEAANAFVDSVIRPEKDKTAVIPFNGQARLVQALTGDKTLLRTAIEGIKIELPADNPECKDLKNIAVPVDDDPRCFTDIWDASWAAVNEVLLTTPDATRRAIILVTDGDDTNSETKKQELIDFATKANTTIYSIGIGDRKNYKIEEKSLLNVSEKTGGRAFFPKGKAELTAAFAQIEQELRSQYLIAYTPTNKTFNGAFRQVRIELVNPELRKQKLRLLYRQGYYAKSNSPAPVAAPSKQLKRP